MQRSTNSYKEERTDFIIGITVVAIALLLLGWLTWSAIKGISDNTETRKRTRHGTNIYVFTKRRNFARNARCMDRGRRDS